jgi:hypothetical protein
VLFAAAGNDRVHQISLLVSRTGPPGAQHHETGRARARRSSTLHRRPRGARMRWMRREPTDAARHDRGGCSCSYGGSRATLTGARRADGPPGPRRRRLWHATTEVVPLDRRGMRGWPGWPEANGWPATGVGCRQPAPAPAPAPVGVGVGAGAAGAGAVGAVAALGTAGAVLAGTAVLPDWLRAGWARIAGATAAWRVARTGRRRARPASPARPFTPVPAGCDRRPPVSPRRGRGGGDGGDGGSDGDDPGPARGHPCGDDPLHVHDDVVQALVVASYALQMGDNGRARVAVDGALCRSRATLDRLQRERGRHGLVRAEPAPTAGAGTTAGCAVSAPNPPRRPAG